MTLHCVHRMKHRARLTTCAALSRRALLLLLALVAVAGCRPDPRPEVQWVSRHQDGVDVPVERLQPGPSPPEPQAWRMRAMPVRNPYAESRKAIAEGRRLYQWMNCVDCHGEGGGSIGPTLWDDQWIYGGRDIDIFESIYYGRPDGMPAFGGHLPADQIWMLVTYVKSLEPRGGLYNEGVK